MERQKKNAPRLSLEGRDESIDTDVKKFEAACQQLEQAGYLLPEDTKRRCQTHRERVLKAMSTTK